MTSLASTALAVGPEDEGLHTPVGDALWSESFYLNFSDGSGRYGGFTRLALHPARAKSGETEGLLCVYLPGGGVGITLVSDTLEQSEAGVVRARGLVHRCVEPLRRWRIQYDGEMAVFDDPARVPAALAANAPGAVARRLRLDLDISGLHPPFFYPNYRRVASPPPHRDEGPLGFTRSLKRALRRPGEILSALRMRSSRHYEQSVRVCGSITVAGERFEVDGTGHRDHSWGLRDWAPSQRWRWLTGQLDGLAFNAMYLTIAGTHVTNGYVWQNGRCTGIDDLRLETTFDETGLGGRDVRLELSAAGEQLTITGEVLMNVPLPITGDGFSTMYNVGWTRYRCGDRVGYGVAEFLERLEP